MLVENWGTLLSIAYILVEILENELLRLQKC